MTIPRGLIGVVHLGPMPGDPRASARDSFEGVVSAALRDARAYQLGGARGLIVENFGSAPFFKGNAQEPVPPHQLACIGRVVQACVDELELPVGVNCLRNDARAALAIAAVSGAAWVRVNVHLGAFVTDQGLIEGEAAHTLRYRALLGAKQVQVWADVLVKHAAPLASLGPGIAVHEAFERGLADAVIVTGDTTGRAVDLERLRQARQAAGDRPLLLGSGVTPENAKESAPMADAAIVGTWVKEGGQIAAPVDPERVKRLAAALLTHLRGSEA